MSTRSLADLWQQTWVALGATPPPDAFGELAARYSEPHRAYHTLAHLAEAFAAYRVLADLAARPGEVELALWYHDVVYEPRRHDNEEASAQRAAEVMQAAGCAADAIERVRALILATRHGPGGESGDAAVLVDADLAILGAPPVRFTQCEAKVRAEYAWVEEGAFRAGRRAVLAAFLERPVIYATARGRTLWEASARRNLAASIARLAEPRPSQ